MGNTAKIRLEAPPPEPLRSPSGGASGRTLSEFAVRQDQKAGGPTECERADIQPNQRDEIGVSHARPLIAAARQ